MLCAVLVTGLPPGPAVASAGEARGHPGATVKPGSFSADDVTVALTAATIVHPLVRRQRG